MGRPRKAPPVDPSDLELDAEPGDAGTAETPDALDTIHSLLKTISPGYRIQVWRQAPREFRGLLEEIEVTDGASPIDLQYLMRTWGGKELRLRVRNKKGQYKGTFDIPLYSHPPLFWGQPIPSQTMPQWEPQTRPAPYYQPTPMTAPPIQSSPAGATLAELLQVLQKYKSTESELLSSLLARQSAPALVPAPALNPYETLNQALDLITKIQGSMPSPSAGSTGLAGVPSIGEGDSLVPAITRLIEIFLTRQDVAKQSVPQARPRPASIPQQHGPTNGNDILASLAQADPADLANVYQGVLSQLPRDKRLRAIEAFESAFEQVEPDLYTDADADTDADTDTDTDTDTDAKPGDHA